MGVKNEWTASRIAIRLAILFIGAVVIWRLVGLLNESFFGTEYNRMEHFIMASITVILSLLLIEVVRRMDQVSWKQLGQGQLRSNVSSFLFGFLLWAIPAGIGLAICIGLGWVEITVQSDFSYILMSIVILLVTVFLIEALPEEFLFRGIMYKYLNVLFPQWATILLQGLIFTLFAFLIGAMYSLEQLQFIPFFGLLLGCLRAFTGNVWAAIGFHVAIMTATQILGPGHGHFEVEGMFTLQFMAFILLPSAIGGMLLPNMYPKHSWSAKTSLKS
ncbi:CPBP family intramembrane glutamic endopeptidase [Bacillus horti]|uniref:Membrane protease YdiL (CAAX protease family) n=1 Tax=Caldalkalibacillus horti TaxID=77523 RepID=A0ABT9VZ11_9BACI|nr:type II CAAX endopeptidase family protein [Bacillus horti]MDQ0166212.1 membrane protease YdiL (CAAX protease family) [Bacillus horti]